MCPDETGYLSTGPTDPGPPPPLTLRLFGKLRALVGGEPICRVRTRSVEWILALLALKNGRPVSRSWLAGTLWPDSAESRALQNLRDDLMRLRTALGPERNRIRSPARDSLLLDLAGADVDVLRFDAATERGDDESLGLAVDLYEGPLLEGCYEEWALGERAAREARYVEALEKLAQREHGRGLYAEAIRLLRRVETIDPSRESAVRGLMAACAANGEPAVAVETYRRLRNRLHENGSGRPDEQTTRLYEMIRERHRKAAQTKPADISGQAGTMGPPSSILSLSRPPHALTQLIGRGHDVEAVLERLADSRILTLVGPGGVGKTRLAMEVAARAGSRYGGEVAWVELGPVTSGGLVRQAISAALGMREEEAPGRDSDGEEFAARLGGQSITLTLDNCEHVLDAAAELAETLLCAAPRLRLLATSRERLGLPGEVVWRVPSLTVPKDADLPQDDGPAIESALASSAVQLFVARADAARPGFRIADRGQAVAVSAICRRLDGIPLAIELAAARVDMLGLDEICRRLDDRFRLLTRGTRSAPLRHKTLQALIEWSYGLLNAREQAMVRRLSVFPDGWTLQAAEDVATGPLNNPAQPIIGAPDVLDLLASLVDKSIVQAETRGSSRRFRMLETIREYAADRLRESGEMDEARNSHLRALVRYARDLAPSLRDLATETTLDELDSEISSVRVALEWARSRSTSADFLALTASLWPYWEHRGSLAEGQALLKTARTCARGPLTLDWAETLLGAATLACEVELADAYDLGGEAVAAFRSLGDWQGLARALICYAYAARETGRYKQATELVEEALQLARENEWMHGVVVAIYHLGLIARLQGDSGRSESLLRDSLELSETVADDRIIADCLMSLTSYHVDRHDYATAWSSLERALEIHRRLHSRHRTILTLRWMGQVSRSLGDLPRALGCLEESEAIAREHGNSRHLGISLLERAGTLYQQGDFLLAKPVIAESLTLFERLKWEHWINCARNVMGSVLFHLGDLEEAGELHGLSLPYYERIDHAEGIAWTLERIGVAAAARGQLQQSARVLGAAARCRAECGTPMPPWDRADYDRAVGALRGRMGDGSFTTAFAEGSNLSPAEAAASVEFARATQQTTGTAADSPDSP